MNLKFKLQLRLKFNKLSLLLLSFLCCCSFTVIERDNKILPSFQNLKIALVAPAGKVTAHEFEELKKITASIMHVSSQLIQNNTFSFLANNDEQRFKQLKEAIEDDNIDIIWCLRGGYGSARIISYLTALPKPKKPKILIGYSDITALHLFFSQKWDWKTIHGAMPMELLKQEKNLDNFTSISNILTHKINALKIDDLKPLNDAARKVSHLNGLTTGGNLTLVQTSIGTIWQIKADNKIVFFEDIDIKAYQLDRVLTQLIQAKVLYNAKAVIFGQFTKGDEEIEKVLHEFSKNQLTIPIYRSNQFGHNNLNLPLIYNVPSNIYSKGNNIYELTMQNK